jgi:hypothetical protein
MAIASIFLAIYCRSICWRSFSPTSAIKEYLILRPLGLKPWWVHEVVIAATSRLTTPNTYETPIWCRWCREKENFFGIFSQSINRCLLFLRSWFICRRMQADSSNDKRILWIEDRVRENNNVDMSLNEEVIVLRILMKSSS